jgi:hypothetical protein
MSISPLYVSDSRLLYNVVFFFFYKMHWANKTIKSSLKIQKGVTKSNNRFRLQLCRLDVIFCWWKKKDTGDSTHLTIFLKMTHYLLKSKLITTSITISTLVPQSNIYVWIILLLGHCKFFFKFIFINI